jgi:hypothetical protein
VLVLVFVRLVRKTLTSLAFKKAEGKRQKANGKRQKAKVEEV